VVRELTLTRLKKRGKKKKANWLLYGLAVFLLLLLFVGLYMYLFQGSNSVHHLEERKVAIIDQLSITHPNTTFWHTVQSIFKEEGLKTYYFQGGSDTVDFYRGLSSRGFSLIILRAHSAISLDTGNLVLFTNEKWSDSKASTTYLADIMADRLAKVRVEEGSPEYFGIFPNFVRAMNGNFNNTVIIMMGCDTLINPSMAEAFIQKGAKLCIGWTGPVSVEHADNSIIHFLKHLITEKETISEAVSKTTEELGEDPHWGGGLAWYPLSEGNLVFTEIIKLTLKNRTVNTTVAFNVTASVSSSFRLLRRKHTYFKIQQCK
jgi:hypothetical protein